MKAIEKEKEDLERYHDLLVDFLTMNNFDPKKICSLMFVKSVRYFVQHAGLSEKDLLEWISNLHKIISEEPIQS